ncbi:MAG: TspO/MBR family protein [Patescibacteria group bacterium]
MKTNLWIPYLVCVVASLLAGGIGSYFTFEAISTWYMGLTLPSWTPPNWVFGPVWTTLYVLMGVSAGLVWKSTRADKKWALYLFFFHLLVNAAWSIVFFGLRDPVSALLIIKALWLLIVALMILFWKYSKLATYLLIPYLVWVSYATSLNLGVILLNPLI